jgi:hypothetical protein
MEMKKYILILLLLAGCTTYPEYVGIDYPVQSPYYTPNQPPLINYNTLPLQEYLRRCNSESEQLRQFALRSTNRKDLVQAILQSQAANQVLYYKLKNPWNGFYLMR